MSRSHRHTPIIGVTTAKSDRPWKRAWNKWFRLAVRRAIYNEDELPICKSAQDRESYKDGKRRFNPNTEANLMRK